MAKAYPGAQQEEIRKAMPLDMAETMAKVPRAAAEMSLSKMNGPLNRFVQLSLYSSGLT